MNKRWKTIVLGQLAISMFALTATAQEIPAPPWLMSGTYGIEVGYALDEATVWRHMNQVCGQPWRRTTAGPCPAVT